MSLPGGSNIFREVLQEFVKPCPYEQSDDSSDDGSKSDEELFVSRKDSPRQKQKQLRVQWADESSQTPLAAEPYETHSARIFTKTVPKPILKCKPNYLIVMPQWTNCSWIEATFPYLMDKLIVFCSFCPVKMRRDETLHRNISSSWPMKSRHDDTLWTSKVMAETMTSLDRNWKEWWTRRTHSVTLSIRGKSKCNIINDCNSL